MQVTFQTTTKSNTKNTRDSFTQFIITKWSKNDPPELYKLEEKTWAPWLRKPQDMFVSIAKRYPDNQRKIVNNKGDLVAMVSTNRINWDGNVATLPSWDSVAGGSVELGDFTRTYDCSGNTLCIMSISVDPDMQCHGLATILFREIINMAEFLGVKYLIASFRPFGYGSFKLVSGNEHISFEEYCRIIRDDGLPLDPWLRVSTRYGMTPLQVENEAIKVEVSLATFEEYKNKFNKKKWKRNSNGQWECGEVGSWTIDGDKAIYVESNLWCKIPIE